VLQPTSKETSIASHIPRKLAVGSRPAGPAKAQNRPFAPRPALPTKGVKNEVLHPPHFSIAILQRRARRADLTSSPTKRLHEGKLLSGIRIKPAPTLSESLHPPTKAPDLPAT